LNKSYSISGIKIALKFPKSITAIENPPLPSFSISSKAKTDFSIIIKHGEILPVDESLIVARVEIKVPGFSQTKWVISKLESAFHCNIPFSDNEDIVLKVLPKQNEWTICLPKTCNSLNPFFHPLGSLLQYFMISEKKGLFIHAAGVSYKGKGFLFTGQSGRGKSTLFNLFKNKGATTIHDDRMVVLDDKKSGFQMYSSPVNPTDKPVSANIDRIFLIEHGKSNELLQLGPSASAVAVLANCIQHNYDKTYTENRLDTISELVKKVKVYRLRFVPNTQIVDFIENECFC